MINATKARELTNEAHAGDIKIFNEKIETTLEAVSEVIQREAEQGKSKTCIVIRKCMFPDDMLSEARTVIAKRLNENGYKACIKASIITIEW